MMFAQAVPPAPSFWNAPHNSSELFLKIGLALLVGFGFVILCLFLPTKARRPIVATVTFLAGGFWVAYYLWPSPRERGPADIPDNFVESVGFWLSDANPIVGNFANIINAFIIGLGIFSLIRVHTKRMKKGQKDRNFSVLLLGALLAMIVFGYWDFKMKLENPEVIQNANWTFVQYSRDLLFEGLFQVMESAMFSIIAFYILSAAYRAFRIRSIEATILLSAALIMMLSLMGWLVHFWDGTVSNMADWQPDHFANNLKLTAIAGWINANLQTPGIRAIEFGIGLGALAMGLRLWLSLERGGVNR